jgi:Complex I intermediate-associated protein 30 (CIA30)
LPEKEKQRGPATIKCQLDWISKSGRPARVTASVVGLLCVIIRMRSLHFFVEDHKKRSITNKYNTIMHRYLLTTTMTTRTTAALICICLLPLVVQSFAVQNGTPPSPPKDRVAWDGLRFLQQSSKFIAWPSLLARQPKKGSNVLSPGDVIWTVGSNDNTFTMAPLDDVVMGGASASTFDATTGMWSATVTDANNGGFVGLRNTPALVYDATACRGLTWDVRLVGTTAERPVKFVLRDSTDFNGVTHTYQTMLKPGRNTVQIPFDRLVPAKFANVLNDGKCSFTKNQLAGVQITYSKFEFNGKLSRGFVTGDWQLQLMSLRAY